MDLHRLKGSSETPRGYRDELFGAKRYGHPSWREMLGDGGQKRHVLGEPDTPKKN